MFNGYENFPFDEVKQNAPILGKWNVEENSNRFEPGADAAVNNIASYYIICMIFMYYAALIVV